MLPPAPRIRRTPLWGLHASLSAATILCRDGALASRRTQTRRSRITPTSALACVRAASQRTDHSHECIALVVVLRLFCSLPIPQAGAVEWWRNKGGLAARRLLPWRCVSDRTQPMRRAGRSLDIRLIHEATRQFAKFCCLPVTLKLPNYGGSLCSKQRMTASCSVRLFPIRHVMQTPAP